jgi:hypothetical protein
VYNTQGFTMQVVADEKGDVREVFTFFPKKKRA